METTTHTTSLALISRLQPLLSDREELLWTGQPRQGLILRGYDLFLVPFSLLWGGGILVGFGSAILSGAPGFINPIFFFFVAVAFYITIGRFLIDAYMRAKTTYGITNRRIIIQNEGIGGKTHSYDLKTLSNLSVEQGRNGRGTVTIGPPPYGRMNMRGFTFPGMGTYEAPAFEQIPNAQQVYELIQDIRA